MLLAVLGVLALAIGYLAFRGARSPLRPLLVPLAAWRLALASWRFNRKVLLAISALILFSAALQVYFVNASGYDAQVLQFFSIAWQALVAALSAAIAAPLHLFVIHGFWRARVADPAEGGRKLTPLMLRAAAFGLAIWIFDYLVGVATKIVTLSTDPNFRQAEYAGLVLASFALTSLLALVRPSLSLGLRHPFRTGIGMAAKNALALYVVLAVLAIPASVLGPEATLLPRLLIRSRPMASLVSVALISALNVFQYLAVEIATVLFALGVVQRATDEARTAAGLEARDLPLPATR
ncbi:MAG TPA: hypothetical protein VHS81_13750 [Caulobacteraceae bacterium]|nr:hypothetical protein [Caulobacteraceae bacterium]